MSRPNTNVAEVLLAHQQQRPTVWEDSAGEYRGSGKRTANDQQDQDDMEKYKTKIWHRPPSGKDKPKPPNYHVHMPGVQKDRPSTASKASSFGEYKVITSVMERHDTALRVGTGKPLPGSPQVSPARSGARGAASPASQSPRGKGNQNDGPLMDPNKAIELQRRGQKELLARATGMSMEILTVVQQVDQDIMDRPNMLEFATKGHPYAKGGKGKATPWSPVPAPPGLGAGVVLEETEEDKAQSPSGRHWHRRSPREVLEKKTQNLECYLAHKLEDHLRGEERRILAAEVRISRPIVERQIQLKMFWLKVLYTAQPVIILAEVLRQARARHVLRTLFSIQLVRFAKRVRDRHSRKEWLEGRLKNMERPTVEQLRQAVPLLKVLPLPVQQEIRNEMLPRCFREKEYVQFSSVRALTLQKRLASGASKWGKKGAVKPKETDDANDDDHSATPQPEKPWQSSTAPNPTSGSTAAPGKEQFGNQEMFYVSSGSAVAHITLGSGVPGGGGTSTFGGGAPVTVGGGADTKLLEVYVPGHVIGLEQLLGADIKRQMTVARTDIDGWVVPVQRIYEAIETTGDDVRHMLAKLASNRRKEAMRLQPLSVAQVQASSPILSGWSAKGVKHLIELMVPTIFQRDEEVRLRGGVYLVVRGRMEKTVEKRRGGPEGTPASANFGSSAQGGQGSSSGDYQIIKAGMLVGDKECFLEEGPSAKHKKIILRALSDADVWVVQRRDFMDLAVHENIEALLPLFDAAGSNLPTSHSGGGAGASLYHSAPAINTTGVGAGATLPVPLLTPGKQNPMSYSSPPGLGGHNGHPGTASPGSSLKSLPKRGSTLNSASKGAGSQTPRTPRRR